MKREDLPFDPRNLFIQAPTDDALAELLAETRRRPEPEGDPNFRAPDLVEAITDGWRAWKVAGELTPGENPKLYSVSHMDYYWKPREFSAAICDGNCGEDVPGEKHGCGFYTARTLPHLMSMGYEKYYGGDDGTVGSYCVIGQVALWGKVIPGSQGWRAQKAYPVWLGVPFEIYKIAKPLSETYGVPVKLVNFLKPAKEVTKELGLSDKAVDVDIDDE